MSPSAEVSALGDSSRATILVFSGSDAERYNPSLEYDGVEVTRWCQRGDGTSALPPGTTHDSIKSGL